MAFTENLSVFFNDAEFAVSAEIRTAANALVRTVKIIFETPGQGIPLYDTTVEAGLPTALCKTPDVSDLTRAHKFVINSVTYRIHGFEHDGTGVTTVQLRG